MTINRLLHGIVVESNAESWTGKFLYSDFAVQDGIVRKNSLLNDLVQIPVIGIVAGITRMALGIIHCICHLYAYAISGNNGHLYHTNKGLAEILRGTIETIPVIGRIFANLYMPMSANGRCWWMIKMYNPDKPDGLDRYMDRWVQFQQFGPQFYVRA